MEWSTVIGLEIHTQLQTKSKLFSAASTQFGNEPNVCASYIDAGLPGTLPVCNQEVIAMALRFGFAINATVNNNSYFERKNYFYPDLPKGYQISQYRCPIISDGFIVINLANGKQKKVTITRAHLEEDAGKLLHYPDYSGVDLNRAGTPLLEIVTDPCLSSAEEAVNTLKTIHQLVRFLKICDGNMEQGSLRCDVNISIKPEGEKKLGTRVELKNLNSFRYIEKAILFEELRQQEILTSGKRLKQETRSFSPITNKTEPLRSKEFDSDYRYFSDPDLLPIVVKDTDLATIKNSLPILPTQIIDNFSAQLNDEELNFLLASPENYDFFISVQHAQKQISAKIIINWLKGPYLTLLNKIDGSFADPPINCEILGQLLHYLQQGDISHHAAKQIFVNLAEGNNNLEALVKAARPQMHLEDLEQLVNDLLTACPHQVADYRNGKTKLLGFFIGQLRKKIQGEVNWQELTNILQNKLNGKY